MTYRHENHNLREALTHATNADYAEKILKNPLRFNQFFIKKFGTHYWVHFWPDKYHCIILPSAETEDEAVTLLEKFVTEYGVGLDDNVEEPSLKFFLCRGWGTEITDNDIKNCREYGINIKHSRAHKNRWWVTVGRQICGVYTSKWAAQKIVDKLNSELQELIRNKELEIESMVPTDEEIKQGVREYLDFKMKDILKNGTNKTA